MQISSKFNVVLSQKMASNTVNQGNYVTAKTEVNDTYTNSNTGKSVSFKAGSAKASEKVIEMLKSSNYWKVLGATVAATAATIWKMLSDAGIKDESLDEDIIANYLKNFVFL